MHKKTFSLESGAGLADAQYCIDVYAVEVRDGEVYVDVRAGAAMARAARGGAAGDRCAPTALAAETHA